MKIIASIFLFLSPLYASAQVAYDHHWLVMTWPNGYCAKPGSCSATTLPQHFVIHGLWPVQANGQTTPPYCNPDPNFKTKMQKLTPQDMSELETFWPTLNFADNMSFWMHQWNKHGSCQQFPPVAYFISTLILVKKIEFDSALKAAIPVGTSAKKSSFRNAIQGSVGQGIIPILRCVPTAQDPMLTEIRLCVDKQISQVIPCKNANELRQDTCGIGVDILFP